MLERPWLRPDAGDGESVQRWLDGHGRHRERDLVRIRAAMSAPTRPYDDGLTVVVIGTDPAATSECLRSLNAQATDPGRFEVVVVGSPEIRSALLSAGGTSVLSLRLVVIPTTAAEPGRFSPRLLGVAAARRAYVTFLSGSDRVAPRFVEELLDVAGPEVIGAVPVIDADRDDVGSADEDQAQLHRADWTDAGRVLPTRVAHSSAQLAAARADCEEVFWAVVAAHGQLRWAIHGQAPAPDGNVAVVRRRHPTSPVDKAGLEREVGIIGALSQLTALEDELQTQLRESVTRRVRRINVYLRENPAEHTRVVELLDRHQVAQIPYDVLNRGLARGLLIAYAFPPYADTSAVVMAKRVRAEGAVVDVVANAMDRIRESDDSLLRISGPFTANHLRLPTPTYFSNWASMEEFAWQGRAALRSRTAGARPYDFVYSRAQFAASHFLAAAYKVDNPDIPWRAEFSDPLSRDVTDTERGTPVTEGPLLSHLRDGLRGRGLPVPESTNCFVWCEELAYALADELIFTNRHQLEYMLGYCSNPALAEMARVKAIVRPHPTLPAQFYSMGQPQYGLESGVAHLAYFGNFYATRGLDELLQALSALPRLTRVKLRLHIMTTRPADLERRIGDLNLTEIVRVRPYVRYLEFLALTRKFDCLIVNDAAAQASHGKNPYLPSKWSDYRGSGTPVWGLCEAGSTLSGQDLAYSSPIGDVAAAAEVLTQIAAKI
ncbi:hypothetical protein AB0H43_38590 [Hamadaea sp. NPDC050747]|uniref:hypothetical protein n=1 Tax=Hamadaea sp. NPDC050747 TaxID=3155789 RepID=UPI0033F34A40